MDTSLEGFDRNIVGVRVWSSNASIYTKSMFKSRQAQAALDKA